MNFLAFKDKMRAKDLTEYPDMLRMAYNSIETKVTICFRSQSGHLKGLIIRCLTGEGYCRILMI